MNAISVLICSAILPSPFISRHAQALQQTLIVLDRNIYHMHSSKFASTNVHFNKIHSPRSVPLSAQFIDQLHLCVASFHRARSCAAACLKQQHPHDILLHCAPSLPQPGRAERASLSPRGLSGASEPERARAGQSGAGQAGRASERGQGEPGGAGGGW